MLRSLLSLVVVVLALETPVVAQPAVTPSTSVFFDSTDYATVDRFDSQVDTGPWVSVGKPPASGAVNTVTIPMPTMAAGTHAISIRACNTNGCSAGTAAFVVAMGGVVDPGTVPGAWTVTAAVSNDTPVITPPGTLIAAYGFNEGSGSTVSGIGVPGAITGATWVPGKYGQALSLTGTNQWVNFGNVNLIGSFTVMTWMQTRSLYAGTCGSLVMKASDVGFEICDQRLYAELGAGGTWGVVASQSLTSADLNVWRHVALTYDGTTARLYVGGTLVGSSPRVHASNGSPLLVGSWDTRIEFWNGLVDEVRIYGRALSQAEVQADMTVPVP